MIVSHQSWFWQANFGANDSDAVQSFFADSRFSITEFACDNISVLFSNISGSIIAIAASKSSATTTTASLQF